MTAAAGSPPAPSPPPGADRTVARTRSARPASAPSAEGTCQYLERRSLPRPPGRGFPRMETHRGTTAVDSPHSTEGHEFVRATVMYGAGDVRVEQLPDPVLEQPTDALVRVVRTFVCGSDLHPYHSMPASAEGTQMGHEFIGVVEEVGSAVATAAPRSWSASGTCRLRASTGRRPRRWRDQPRRRPAVRPGAGRLRPLRPQ